MAAARRVIATVAAGLASGARVTHGRAGGWAGAAARRAPAAARWRAPVRGAGVATWTHNRGRDDMAVAYPPAVVRVAKAAPTFTAPAVVDGAISKVNTADSLGKWLVLFFYPKDFTTVCPTELRAFSERAHEFAALGCDVMAVSTDTAESHKAWIDMPAELGGLGDMHIPIIADVTKTISATYGVLLEDDGIALRGLFIMDPDGVVQHASMNNNGVARSLDETLRLVQAFQFYRDNGDYCLYGWQPSTSSGSAAGGSAAPSASDTAGDAAEASEDGAASTQADAPRDAPPPPPSNVVDISAPEEFVRLTSERPTVVAFHADWCMKCKTIMPVFDELSEEFSHLNFARFDTGKPELGALADTMNLQALPTFRVYHGNKVVSRKEVFGHKPKQLRDLVQRA